MVADYLSQHHAGFKVSTKRGSGPVKDKVGSEHCRGDARPKLAEGIWCLHADPVTTTGEAMTIGELAKKEGWTSVTAVTDRPHTHGEYVQTLNNVLI